MVQISLVDGPTAVPIFGAVRCLSRSEVSAIGITPAMIEAGVEAIFDVGRRHRCRDRDPDGGGGPSCPATRQAVDAGEPADETSAIRRGCDWNLRSSKALMATRYELLCVATPVGPQGGETLGPDQGCPSAKRFRQSKQLINEAAPLRPGGSHSLHGAAKQRGIEISGGSPRASDDSRGGSSEPTSEMAHRDAFACRYPAGLRRWAGDVIGFLWNGNGTLSTLRPPSTRFWRD